MRKMGLTQRRGGKSGAANRAGETVNCADVVKSIQHLSGRSKCADVLSESPRKAAQVFIRKEFSFVASPEFDSANAQGFLADLPSPGSGDSESSTSDLTGKASPTQRAGYAAGWSSRSLLTAEQELHIFRRMNYAKFLANQIRSQLNPSKPDRAKLNELAKLVKIAECDLETIIESNVRLVVSIAKRFTSDMVMLGDLVSEGNLALLRAADKFDYYRGNRFSTYATHAVRRAVFRLVVKRKGEKRRCHDNDQLDATATEYHPDQGIAAEKKLASLYRALTELMGRLNPREEWVVRERFGLGNTPSCKTFQELGTQLGVCKERVRQIQLRAMEKLRDWAGVDLEDMLSAV